MIYRQKDKHTNTDTQMCTCTHTQTVCKLLFTKINQNGTEIQDERGKEGGGETMGGRGG